MVRTILRPATTANSLLTLVFLAIFVFQAAGQDAKSVYSQVKGFALNGGKAEVTDLVFKRDRVTMTFTGTFFFATPIDGKITGAVFVGQGTFRADAPPSDFEKANMKRLLGNDQAIESDFKTAVMRFSDSSASIIAKTIADGPASGDAVALAASLNDRLLRETGANLASRITLSILDREMPGVFFSSFDGGKAGRFNYILDPQNRIPSSNFGINAGEKGIIFAYDQGNVDVWMAFYSLGDYAKGSAVYSDQSDLIDISKYDMKIDLTQPKKRLGVDATLSITSRTDNLRAISFNIGESLGQRDDLRLKKQMHVRSAAVGSTAVDIIQEDWESGFTVLLAEPLSVGQKIDLEMQIDGDFLRQPETFSDCSYPLSNSDWYPRHGYLNRSTFSFTFTHPKKFKVAASGTRQSELVDPTNKDQMITKYVMSYPVALVTFALGPFERHTETIKWENGGKSTPLEFNSMPGGVLAIKEDFILAELSNSARYFQNLFGKYPYESFGAVFHPYNFGQGFATLLTIPATDRDSKFTYLFLSHETAHQWWGNIVLWRSYRDQWLSEGFAEYSGILYTGFRENAKTAASLIDQKRRSLSNPPQTGTGIGKGKLNDIGPLTLGRRLRTKKSYNAYNTLVYNKGALVLRMIHFLMTDPSTGDGQPFYVMMNDFVEKYRNSVASTEDFRVVAGEHFAKTPIAKKYGLKDLDWFFREWIYDTEFPSYRMEYQIQDQPDGSVLVTGEVLQSDTSEKMFMPLPIVIRFGGDKVAYGTVAALGPKTPFSFKLPIRPASIELDPDKWVLSEKTSTGK